MVVEVIEQNHSLLRRKGRATDMRDAVLNMVVKESLTKDVGSEKGPKGNEVTWISGKQRPGQREKWSVQKPSGRTGPGTSGET